MAEAVLAGEAHIGQVGGEGSTISVTPVIDTGIYASGDLVGDLMTFADFARVSGGGGYISQVVILDNDKEDAELELWLFSESIAPGTDNDAWTISDANLAKLVTVISTTDGAYYDAAANSAAVIEVARRLDAALTDLFGVLVTRGTPTYTAATDLTVKVSFAQD